MAVLAQSEGSAVSAAPYLVAAKTAEFSAHPTRRRSPNQYVRSWSLEHPESGPQPKQGSYGR